MGYLSFLVSSNKYKLKWKTNVVTPMQSSLDYFCIHELNRLHFLDISAF